MYDLFHVRLNIRKNLSFYLFLVLELILCFTLVIMGLDEQRSYQSRKDIYKAESELGLYTITDSNGMLVDMQTTKHSKELDELELVYADVYNGSYLSKKDKVQNFQVVIANEAFFKDILKIEAIAGKAYLTEKASSMIDEIEFILPAQRDEMDMKFDSNKFILEDEALELENIITNASVIPTKPDNNLDIITDSAIFILTNEKIDSRPWYSFIKADKDLNHRLIEGKLEDIYGRSFRTIDISADFESGSDNLSGYIRLFSWAAAIAISIVIFGASSMILIFVERRKEKTRIQHYFGATSFRLKLQLFLELYIIFFVAMLVSCLISYFVEPLISSVYYDIKLHTSTVIFINLFCLFMALFITLFSSGSLKEERHRR